MKTLTNNEGSKVQVTESVYDELKNDFNNGVWMAIIKCNGFVHSIILPENF